MLVNFVLVFLLVFLFPFTSQMKSKSQIQKFKGILCLLFLLLSVFNKARLFKANM